MPVHLTWRDLRYAVPAPAPTSVRCCARGSSSSSGAAADDAAAPPRERVLLDGLSGSVPPGTILAIMGASGAGKSTLLSVLTGRIPAGAYSGAVLVNGEAPDASFPRVLGFVSQDVPMLAFLTVRETLMYAARLRLPESLPRAEKARRVDALLEDLDLTRAAHTRVGLASEPGGISGGERRRLALACELLHEPQLLIADELTSGLDAAAALRIVLILRRLAHVRRQTVLLTVHQPRAELMPFFDQLLLLAGGRTAYLGPTWRAADAAVAGAPAGSASAAAVDADGAAAAATAAVDADGSAADAASAGKPPSTPPPPPAPRSMLEYFSAIGYPFPPYSNPADTLIDLVNSDHDGLLADVAAAEAAAAAVAAAAAAVVADGGGAAGAAAARPQAADAACVAVVVPSGSDGGAAQSSEAVPAAAAPDAAGEGAASAASAAPAPAPALASSASGSAGKTLGSLSVRRAGVSRQAAAEDLIAKYAASPLAAAARAEPPAYPPRPTPAFGGAGKRRHPTRWCTQVGVVAERAFFFKLRNPDAALALFIGTVVMAVILATTFWRMPATASGVRDRMSAIAFLILTQSFAAFDQVVVAPIERPVALRDEQNGAYR
jgi:ABC-type multidrug transport system ATPase subunit